MYVVYTIVLDGVELDPIAKLLRCFLGMRALTPIGWRQRESFTLGVVLRFQVVSPRQPTTTSSHRYRQLFPHLYTPHPLPHQLSPAIFCLCHIPQPVLAPLLSGGRPKGPDVCRSWVSPQSARGYLLRAVAASPPSLHPLPSALPTITNLMPL